MLASLRGVIVEYMPNCVMNRPCTLPHVKSPPTPELLHLELARPSALRRSDERVVAGMVEAADVGHVGAELAREIRRLQR